MRLTQGLGLNPETPPVKPTSNWKANEASLSYAKISPKELLGFRIFAWALLIFSAIYIFTFLRTPIADNQVWIMHIKGYIVLVLMHFVLAYLYKRQREHLDIGRPLRQLRTKVPREDAVPIQLRVVQQKVVTGFDEGYIWFDEEILYYKGRQTAFRINRDDVPPLSMIPSRKRPKPSSGRYPNTLPIPVNNRNITLDWKYIDPFEDFGTRRRTHEFQSQLSDWLNDNNPGQIESLLPPIEVHPALAQNGWTRIEPLFASGLLVAINAILTVSMFQGYEMNSEQSFLRYIAMAIHIAMLIFALTMAFQAWKTSRIRDSISESESNQNL